MLIAITVVAFILRLLVAWEISGINNGINSMFTPAKTTDLATYMDLAKEIVKQEETIGKKGEDLWSNIATIL